MQNKDNDPNGEMAKQCLSRVPTATHWKWLPGSLYEKDDSGLGTKSAMMVNKSRSRVWWILSIYSFSPVQIKLMCNIYSQWGNVRNMKYQEYFPFSIVVTLQPPDKKKVLYVILIVGRLFPSFNFFLMSSIFILSPILPSFSLLFL